MKTTLFSFALVILAFIFVTPVSAQGLPPGWEYVSTPTTHIISIPLTSNPNINGYALQPGDWIGVFYVNGQGGLSCGGAIEWNGTTNTGIIAFGNDSWTPEKDGFANGELINYKVYSWSVQQTYDAIVTCNDALPNTCLNFTPNGLSGLATLDAAGFYLVVQASEASVCSGSSVQLNAIPSGGTGSYTFSWSSLPPGFSSNISNPITTPLVTTEFICQVSSGNGTISATVVVEVIPSPIANAGDNQSICSGQDVQLNGSADNASSYFWTTGGDGIFSNSAILNPSYIPGSDDIANGSVELCLTAESIPSCPNSTDCLFVTINPLPAVTLDPFPEYCAGDPSFTLFGGLPVGGVYYINGNQSVTFNPSSAGIFVVSYQYTDPGGCSNSANGQIVVNPLPVVTCPDDMTVCCDSNPIQLNAAIPEGGIYSGDGVIDNVFYPDCDDPGDFLISYEYMHPTSECVNSCSFMITVAPLPEVTCPTDFEVCINVSAFPLTGAFPANGTYSGNGVNMNMFDPTLAGLGQHEISYFFSDANGCSSTCSFFIEVKPLPSVNAGFPQVYIILPNTSYVLVDATAVNFDLIQWTTDGTGVFDDPNVINPEYTLSEDDILAGSVVLTMTGSNECGSVSDMITIIVNECQPAIVDAGNDVTICEDSNLSVSDANALLFESLIWSNNGGDGSFDDPTLINPTYFPGENDIESGSVLLTLTAYPLELCDTVSDSKLLSIVKLPVANSGTDQTICEDANVELAAEVANFAFAFWETNGDGAFENPWELQTVYYPGELDIAGQQVTIWLTVIPNAPCSEMIIDELSVFITKLPFLDAGEDATIVAGESLQLNAAASDYAFILWSSSGDGVFNFFDILNPVYTPGAQDILNAGATLELAAFPLSPCNTQVIDPIVLTIDTLTGMNDRENNSWIKVFPNPVASELYVTIDGFSGNDIQIKLFDLNGRIIFEDELTNNRLVSDFTYSLNTSFFECGLYLIRISSSELHFTAKIKITKP
jgi:hypothetical protein